MQKIRQIKKYNAKKSSKFLKNAKKLFRQNHKKFVKMKNKRNYAGFFFRYISIQNLLRHPLQFVLSDLLAH